MLIFLYLNNNIKFLRVIIINLSKLLINVLELLRPPSVVILRYVPCLNLVYGQPSKIRWFLDYIWVIASSFTHTHTTHLYTHSYTPHTYTALHIHNTHALHSNCFQEHIGNKKGYKPHGNRYQIWIYKLLLYCIYKSIVFSKIIPEYINTWYRKPILSSFPYPILCNLSEKAPLANFCQIRSKICRKALVLEYIHVCILYNVWAVSFNTIYIWF